VFGIIVFPSKKNIFYELLLELVEKIKCNYTFINSAQRHFVTISFDLWMSVGHDIFALVICFKELMGSQSKLSLVKNLT
jgi:hypothetical protein